jgi:hypothetical protein
MTRIETQLGLDEVLVDRLDGDRARPTAEATRLTDPYLTSPAAKTPGMLVSMGSGGRPSGQPRGGRPSCRRSGPVTT